MLGYAFTQRGVFLDGSAMPIPGEWKTHEGEIGIGLGALYMSKNPINAMKRAGGSCLHHVDLIGDLATFTDDRKPFYERTEGKRMKIIASIDASPMLIEFLRWLCANYYPKETEYADRAIDDYIKLNHYCSAYVYRVCKEVTTRQMRVFGMQFTPEEAKKEEGLLEQLRDITFKLYIEMNDKLLEMINDFFAKRNEVRQYKINC